MANTQLSTKPKFDLEERTAKFGEEVIDFCKKLPKSLVSEPIIKQLVCSGTSIGANYMEADEASSKKDFVNKITIAKKESKETRYWLRMVAHTFPEYKDEADRLQREARELNLILAAIVRSSKSQ